MKDIGMTIRLKNLGRLVIPKEILNTCDIQPLDSVEFFVDVKTGILAFAKYSGQSCTFCGSIEELSYFKNSLICKKCSYLIKNGGASKTRRRKD